jgi:hypothetical protein
MRTQHTKIEGFTRALSRAVEADHASWIKKNYLLIIKFIFCRIVID